jgi:superfamily II DNA or RNA helicase
MKAFEESFLDPDFMSVGQAADFVGASEQTLRRWEQEGKLKPVRHPMNNYRYYRRADLEKFKLDYRRAEDAVSADDSVFQTARFKITDNPQLREPQKQGWVAVRDHFAKSSDAVTLQIPVGCGKTGLISILPMGVSRGKVLVLVPNVTIRDGVTENLELGPKNFWRKTGVLSEFKNGPFTAVLDGLSANIHDCIKSDFVVANIQQLASAADRWLPQFPPNFFEMIVVDEGHHNAAPSWKKVFERFPEAKVVSLTATPFRGDKKQVAGQIIYRYPFTKAMINGYIKQIHAYNIAPDEIYFTYRGETRHHTLDEVLDLREEEWFSKGVALSPECNRHIVEASIQKLQQLREGSHVKHQIIAVACSVDHARQVRSLYEERGLRAREMYSEMPDDEKEKVFAQLEQGRLDCIVQVQMLGEGFDHPPLGVAAVFRPFRSLTPYIQFIGRIMRVVKQNAPGDPDNRGFIVSHVGMNNDPHWEEFRELDLDDQRLIQQWLAEVDDSQVQGGERDGGGQPRRFDIGMRVTEEILGSAFNDAFLDPDDDRVLDRVLESITASVSGFGITPEQLGLSREQLRARLKASQPQRQEDPAEELPVSPQKRRQALRKRLSERTKAVAARVMSDLKLKTAGHEIGNRIRKYAGEDNGTIIHRMLSAQSNALVGVGSRQRANMSDEQLQASYDALDKAGDLVRDEIKKSNK